MSAPNVAADFPTASAEDWLQLVDDVLKGAPFEKRLVTRTHAPGIDVQPLYDRAFERAPHEIGLPGFAPHTRGANPARHGAMWDIRQRHNLIDPATTNAEILDDLEQGATSILLRTFGDVSADDIARALDGVLLDVALIAFDAGPWAGSLDDAVRAYCEANEISPSARLIAHRADPLGSLARHGTAGSASLASITGQRSDGSHSTLIGVDATPYVDAGADAVQEIGWSLATGAHYLRQLVDEHGWSVDDVAGAMEFTFAATADQFTTIAKLRAARTCWARIIEACGGSITGQRQHAMTPESMFTRRDPWVNLLRMSTACFGAAVGGADAITVLPFDTALGQPDELARRTARNVQLLLQEESHLGQVIDPAGGSWYVEDHTHQLATAAWGEFQDIEAEGGMFAALTSGTINRRLSVTVNARRDRLRTRKDALTGVSEFADVNEASLSRTPWPEATAPGGMALAPFRAADEYEVLGDAIARAAAGGQDVSAVRLINLGTPADWTARATYSANFLAAGGIRTSPTDLIATAEDSVAAWQDGQAPVAIICGSDAQYAELVDPIATALKSAGCPAVWVAGNPGDSRAAWGEAGVDDYIHMGVDVIDCLHRFHTQLGISA